MKIILTQQQFNLIFEFNSKKVNCEKCEHNWEIKKTDNYPYLCHSCGYDSHKKKYNYKELKNFWKNYKKKEDHLMTESQYQKFTEEKLREFLYGFWNNQKKHGEDPSLDDMLFRVLSINKHTREDYDTVRPIWYEYNGGYNVLFEKLKNKINNKEYRLTDAYCNLDTTIKVVMVKSRPGYVEIVVDVDPRGTMDYYSYDDEGEQDNLIRDTIDAAYMEALDNYEGSELTGLIRSIVYTFFDDLLEKYGLPIDVDTELEEIDGTPYGINENQQKFTKKSDIIKNMWDKEKKEKGYATFDEDILQYFNITDHQSKYDYSTLFTEYIGGFDEALKIINKITMNNFNTKDFPKKIVGGYDFKWRISHLAVQDDEVFMESEIDYGGTVTLIGDGRTITLDDATNNGDFWWEIESEIRDVIEDCMNFLIKPKTGIKINVQYVTII